MIIKNKILGLGVFFLALVAAIGFGLLSSNELKAPSVSAATGNPRIVIGNYKSVIGMLSSEEPKLEFGGYDLSGTAEVTVYKANQEALLDFLVYEEDKDGNNKDVKQVDTGSFEVMGRTSIDFSEDNNRDELVLPFEHTGIFFVSAKLGEISTRAFVVRSNIGVVLKEGTKSLIFWSQDVNQGTRLGGVSLDLYNLENKKTKIGSLKTNNDGIATTPINEKIDIAIANKGDAKALVPVNLLNVDYHYPEFAETDPKFRSFLFTDRPLYKPGDTVQFKAVVRNDDWANYSLPSGQATVSIYKGYGKDDLVWSTKLSFSKDGSIDGEYQLPETIKTGDYQIYVEIPGKKSSGYYSNDSFSVEYYRKPDYQVGIDFARNHYLASDNIEATLEGRYFWNQPLSDQEVNYRVRVKSSTIGEGKTKLNDKGLGSISLDKNALINALDGYSGSVEVNIDFTDATQNYVSSRTRAWVYPGNFSIDRHKDARSSYFVKLGEEYKLPLQLNAIEDYRAELGKISLNAKIERVRWVEDANTKYSKYTKKLDLVHESSITTDNNGVAMLNFKPSLKGSYEVSLDGKDDQGNIVKEGFYFWVSDSKYIRDGSDQNLSLRLDKEMYDLGDKLSLSVLSSVPNRDILLAWEKGVVTSFEVIKLQEEGIVITKDIADSHMPNFSVGVYSFYSNGIDTVYAKIPVSTDSKKMTIDIKADKEQYGPGDNVDLLISTKDTKGNPLSTELAVWAVDKALFELVYDNDENIFDVFWQRYFYHASFASSLTGIRGFSDGKGGCFVEGTKVLMADGSYKDIGEIKRGDELLTWSDAEQKLVSSKVLKEHSLDVEGYYIINNEIRVTGNHRVSVDGAWRQVKHLQIGDSLFGETGDEVEVSSIQWQSDKTRVYNLEVAETNTYFADGVLAHNGGKGGERGDFSDTAYWNPSIITDSNGEAKLSFKLPDNLTTWVISALGATSETVVGQSETEIIASKEVVIRPIVPNIVRLADKIELSALVSNFTNQSREFKVDLVTSGFESQSNSELQVSLEPNTTEQVSWEVIAGKSIGEKELIFSAFDTNNLEVGDKVIQPLVLEEFGFWDKSSQAGEGAVDYTIDLSGMINNSKTKAVLSLSTNTIQSLESAMDYLIRYPYGCTEQTVSSMAPAIIAKENPTIFADLIKEKELDDIINKGIKRLEEKQRSDGGWNWWGNKESSYLISGYVVEYLLRAQDLGFKIDHGSDVIAGAKRFFSKDTLSTNTKHKVARNYGLSLLDPEKMENIDNLSGLTPDYLALAFLANKNSGDSSGKDELIKASQNKGETVFWTAGSWEDFGSTETSTALAIRALKSESDQEDLIASAKQHLINNKVNSYWANTFSTVQVIDALLDSSYLSDELNPDYSYEVSWQGEILAEGRITSIDQEIDPIEIPVLDMSGEVKIKKDGNGKLYSVLTLDKFITDTEAKSLEDGIKIEQEYWSATDTPGFFEEVSSPAVGDTVEVRLKLQGDILDSGYVMVTDELPAGMIPVNLEFIGNRRGGKNYNYYEVTENGVIMPIREMSNDSTLTYLARVVNKGDFIDPPATAFLMYEPSVKGRTSVSRLKINKERDVVSKSGESQDVDQDVSKDAIEGFKFLEDVLKVFTLSSFIGLVLYYANKKFQLREKVSPHFVKIVGKIRQKIKK